MKPTGPFLRRMVIAKQTEYPSIDEIMNAWYQLVPDAKDVNAIILLPTLEAYDDPKNYAFTVNEIPQVEVMKAEVKGVVKNDVPV